MCNALSKHQPDLVDPAVQPSPHFNAIVAVVRETVFAVLTDLKKTTSALDLSDLSCPDAVRRTDRTAVVALVAPPTTTDGGGEETRV